MQKNKNTLLQYCWNPTLTFRIEIVGTSYYRKEIASIAQNFDGSRSMTSCMAMLIPEDQNPHDANAVWVQIEGLKVGYLSREFAIHYRKLLNQLPPGISNTLCAGAMIFGGIITKEKTYDYSIAIDLPENNSLSVLDQDYVFETVRRKGYPALLLQDDGTYTASVWVPAADQNDLSKDLEIVIWTREPWETVNFYVTNRQKIGPGLKVFEMEKSAYESLFGRFDEDCDSQIPEARLVLDGKKRIAKLIVTPTVGGQTNDTLSV